MILNDVKNVLEVINVCGIEHVVFRKEPDDSVVVTGKDKTATLFVFTPGVEGQIVDKTTGIGNIQNVLRRMGLFDLDKAIAEVAHSDEFARNAEIKEGRRRTKIAFTNPLKLHAPKSIPDRELTVEITLDKDVIDKFLSAVAAMGPETVMLSGDATNVMYEISDKEGDVFEDIISQTGSTCSWNLKLSVAHLVRLLKHASKVQDSTRVKIYKDGLVHLDIDGFTFVISRFV